MLQWTDKAHLAVSSLLVWSLSYIFIAENKTEQDWQSLYADKEVFSHTDTVLTAQILTCQSCQHKISVFLSLHCEQSELTLICCLMSDLLTFIW